MKKLDFLLVVILITIMSIYAVSCNKEKKTVTLGIEMSNTESECKVYVDNLTPCWHNGDLIVINDNQICTTSAALGSTAMITDVVRAPLYYAFFPAYLAVDSWGSPATESGFYGVCLSDYGIEVNLPRIQHYEFDGIDQRVDVPMSALGSEFLSFHNLCSLIKVVISSQLGQPFYLKQIEIVAENAFLSGKGTTNITGSASDAITINNGYHDVSLLFGDGLRPLITAGPRNTYVYYIVAPEFPTDNVTITIGTDIGTFSTTKYDVSLGHNKITSVSLTVDQMTSGTPVNIDNGALPGLFTVSPTEMVRFSQGNLQYWDGVYRFAENQYDYVGGHAVLDIGIDGWARLGIVGNVYYNSVRCLNLGYGWDDLFYYPTSNNNSIIDWGTNSISNGGNQTNIWRTLSRSEWDYLYNLRANASNKHCSSTVGGVSGLILLPDNWSLPNGCIFPSNHYTLEQWIKMEKRGAIFLPAAGVLWDCGWEPEGDDPGGSFTGYISGQLSYWCSDSNSYFAQRCYFWNPYDLLKGCSVRLVK